jgi:hypothetical protein
MGKLTLLGLALMTVTSAFAGDNPSTVYVQNVDEKSQLPPVAMFRLVVN